MVLYASYIVTNWVNLVCQVLARPTNTATAVFRPIETFVLFRIFRVFREPTAFYRIKNNHGFF